MDVFYSGIEKEIVDRLQPLTGAGFEVVQLPEVEADYVRPLAGNGRITVCYQNSEAGKPKSTFEIVQEEVLTFNVVIQAKKLRNSGEEGSIKGVHALAEYVKKKIVGFKPSTSSKIWLKSNYFSEHSVDAGYWTYTLVFCSEYRLVEDVTYEDGPLLELVTVNYNIEDSHDIEEPEVPNYVLLFNSDNSWTAEAENSLQFEIPDTAVTVQDMDGNPLGSGSVPSVSGGVVQVTVESGTVQNSNGSYTDTVAVGGTLVVPDTPVTIVNQDGDLLEYRAFPSVEGGTVELTILETGTNSVPLLKTGQTISYATGDDGDLQRGGEVFTLPIIEGVQQLNPFGNKWRFTGVTGGYYDRETTQYKTVEGTVTTKAMAYPNMLLCDWATRDWNGDFLLWHMAYKTLDLDWNTSIQACNSHAVGAFSDGWSMPNLKEMLTLFHQVSYPIFGIPEFTQDGSGQLFFWCSTPLGYNPGAAYVVGSDTQIFNLPKSYTGLADSIPVRLTNISEL